MTRSVRALTATTLAVLMLTAATGCGSDRDEVSAGAGAPGSNDAGGSGSTGASGTVTFDGAPVEPLAGLSCVVSIDSPRIAGEVGDGGWLKMQTGSATYQDGAVSWVSTSGDDRGDLEVTTEGASGSLKMYEEGTANDPGDTEYLELTVDLSC